MNKLLLNARPAIEAPSQKIESDRNFRTAFANRKCGRGVRLQPSDRNRRNGRLPVQQQSGDASTSTKFLTNGKRNAERDDDYDRDTIEVASTRKKRRVNFGGEENNVTMPIENLVTTPAKDFGSRATKRKATPYKRGEVVNEDVDDDDDDNDGEDMKMAINRKLLKIKRSPSSKKPDPKSRANHVERAEDFPVMPSTNIVTDFSTWSTPEERESSITITSNTIIPDNYFNWFPTGPAPERLMSSGLPQFEQKPLFLGPKQDRTVRDDDDDETGQDAKRSRGETWKCETCGKDNDDDESHCQVLVDNGKGGKKKCGTGRSCEVKLGWGNMFSHLTKDKAKCDVCKVFNEKSATKCVSCDSDLPSSTGTNDKSSALASTSTANAAKPSAALGGSIGSKGFSFGGGAPAGNISSTGFSFGNSAAAGTAAAPSSSISSSKTTTGGFTFAAPAPSASSSTATSGGFHFGAPATAKSPAAKTSAASSTTASGGFHFGAPAKEKTPPAKPTAAQSSPPPPASSDAAPKPFSFGSSSAAPASSPSPNVGVTAAPTPSTGTNSGAQLFGNFATSSSAQAPKFSFGTNKDTPAAPTDSAANATFSFGTNTGPSTGSSSAVMPSLGSVATEVSDDRSSKKKRRGGFDSNTASSSQPNMSFGSKTSSEAPAQAGAPAPFSFGNPSTNPTKDNSSIPASGFGSSTAPPSFGNTSNNSLAASGTPAPIPALNFGSTPAPAAPLSFGSTPAPAPTPAAPFSFGSTPAPVAPAFGSTVPAPAAPMTFGSTPAAGPSSGFGSTPAPSNAMNFGSAAPAQSSTTFGSTPAAVPGFGAPMAFGSTTPAPAPVPFGAAHAGQPQPFGNTPVSTFNNTATTFGTGQPTAGAAPLAFGGPAPPAQAPGGFGAGGFGQQTPQQQPPAPPNAGFSLGTGGGGPRGGRTPGRRRIVKARRPGGQR